MVAEDSSVSTTGSLTAWGWNSYFEAFWRGEDWKSTAPARDCAAAEILARRGRVRRMLGGSERQAASCGGRGSGLASGWRLGGGGVAWNGVDRGNAGSLAETEQVCPEITGKEGGRAGNRGECGHGVASVRVGWRFQSETSGTIPGA